MKEKPSPQLTAILALLLGASVGCGFFFGVFLYRHWGQTPRPISSAGFNQAELQPRPPIGTESSAPELEATNAPSSLDMIRAGTMKGTPGTSPSSATPRASAAGALTTLVRQNESRYERLAREYTSKYPVIREYGRDWYNSPDLRRYNVDYMKDRDPIRFALRVAASPNFASLVKKYSARTEIRQFIMEAVRKTPAQLADAASDYLRQDSQAAGLVQRFSRAVGLPEDLFVSAAHGAPTRLPQLQTDEQFRQFVQQGNYDPNQFNNAGSPNGR